jgi:hypothetical protein
MIVRAEVQLIRVRDNTPVLGWLTTLTAEHLNVISELSGENG